MPDDFEKPNKLDNLEQELYSPRHVVDDRARKPLREKNYSVAQDWGPPASKPLEKTSMSQDRSKKNWFLIFFMSAFVFFLGALGYVGYMFFLNNGVKAKDVEILVNAPLTIGAGEPFTFDVLIQNKNQVNMETVDIVVNFPEGTRSVDDISESYRVIREEIGNIATGAVSKKTYSVMLFGEETDKKEISISISYRVENSNALFEKEKKFDTVLKSTPVRLTVTNIKEVTSGQPLTFNVELVSNSTQVLENVIVQATYPFGFTYSKSSINTSIGDRTWVIPKLEPREIVNFTIEGKLEGQNNEERYFSFVTGLEDKVSKNPDVLFGTTGTTISLARPFLELDLAINTINTDVIALNANTSHNAVISFKNNTNYPLRNVSLSLKLEGNAINKDSIQVSEGFYQSSNNTITWDKSTTSKLSSLTIGTSGTVSFSFSGLGIDNNMLLSNPEIIFTAQVEGNRNPENQVPEIIENSVSKKVVLNTQSSIVSKSQYYSSTFSNTGPIPPKAEQRTLYTAVLEIANPTNKIENGIVSMLIPNYVTYEGVFSPSSEDFSYDQVTRRLSWRVGTINSKTGYSGNAPKQIAFQVSIVPSVSQAGTSPNLVYDISFEGTDSYTKKIISLSSDNITTSISDSKGSFDNTVSR